MDVSMSFNQKTAQSNALGSSKHVSDGSNAAFTLSDPDAGDYFVVTVWNDPEYPVPLFSLQGGASSCRWEVNTYHRVAPTLAVEYVGPSSLSVSQAAVFKVKMGNAAYYYEAGPSAGKDRPGWNSQMLGYSRPTLALTAKAITIENGLQINANGADFISHGLLFPNFGKGSAEVLLEVHAGPANQARNGDEWMEYSAPVVAFGERCVLKAAVKSLGEKAVDVELGMAGTSSNRVVRFLRKCPDIAWSGTIFASGTFVVTSDNTAVDILAVNPSQSNWDASPLFERVVLEYRFRDSSNKVTDWVLDESVVAGSYSASFVSGSWMPPIESPDGVYQIRVATQCTSDEAKDAYKGSVTEIIDGMIDRNAPRILGASSSSGAGHFFAGDVLTIVFSEAVVCNMFDTSTKTTIEPKFILTVGTESFDAGDLGYVCQNSEVKIALSAAGSISFKAKFPDSETLHSLSVEISVEGIMDAAGNKAARSTVAVAIDGVRSMETANKNQLDVIEAILVAFAGNAADAVLQAEQAREELMSAANDAADAASQQLQADKDAAESATVAKEEAAEAAVNAQQALEALKASDDVSDDEIDAAAAAVEAADATLAAAEEQEAVSKVNVAEAKDAADTAAAAAVSAAADESLQTSPAASLSSNDSSASTSSSVISHILIVILIVAAMAYQHKLVNANMDMMNEKLDGLSGLSSGSLQRRNSLSQNLDGLSKGIAETGIDEAHAAAAKETHTSYARRTTMQNRPEPVTVAVINNATYGDLPGAIGTVPATSGVDLSGSASENENESDDDDMEI
jgi:hypothetical protein